MSSVNLIEILGNLSQSLIPVESLITGFGYVLGIVLVVSGLVELSKMSTHSHRRASVPLAAIAGGVVLIYLPSSLNVLTTTIFGTSSVIQYTQYNPYDIYSSMKVLLQAAGLLWFVRGTVLMVHAAEPGEQHGLKGFLFVIAGVISVNIEITIYTLNAIFQYLISFTL